ncbi:MAG TPA: hypothetical protein VE954_32020 [Oligoflexus sp.]|uniref:hypothetical protein n=1 Tax=Oligoflexus sp. TaxID=1971216 RepID=UPI002D712CC5|nr:hypothetical protein [Oligoflexus sp.]HYX37753.1 hypothetical protein [Oligoflexus sp.]
MSSKIHATSGIFVLALCIDTSASAEQSQVTLEYPMTIPYGEIADFISENSYQGFGFSSFFGSASNMSWGFSFQWIGWDEDENLATYQQNGATFSGSESREINAYPLLFQGRYELARGPVVPYVGLGLGPAYVEQDQRLGFLHETEYSTQGVYAPEAGLYLNLDSLVLGAGAQYLDSFTATTGAELQGLTVRLAVGFSSF